MKKKVKCNKCGYIGEYDEFPKGKDFFQNIYVKSCPKKCGNSQNPGDASMRMFPGIESPFIFVNRTNVDNSALGKTLFKSKEAS